MKGYIYMIINKVNNKKYIGKRKWSCINTISEDKYMGSGIVLKQAIKKYGIDNFEKTILCLCDTEEELNSKEIEFILSYNATESDEFYNIHAGGSGGNTRAGYSEEQMDAFKLKMKTARVGYKHSDETKRKIKQATLTRENPMKQEKYRNMFSEMHKGEKNPMYGRRMSDEQKERLKQSHNGKFDYNKGKKMSDEQKEKISIASKKVWSNEENKKRWIEARIGLKRSEQAKRNLSAGAYKRYNSFPIDNNCIIHRYNKDMDLEETFYGVDEYFKKYNVKTDRNLKNAIKKCVLFKNSYWKIEFSGQSTIESTMQEKDLH